MELGQKFKQIDTQLNDHTQTLGVLTQAVEGLVELAEKGAQLHDSVPAPLNISVTIQAGEDTDPSLIGEKVRQAVNDSVRQNFARGGLVTPPRQSPTTRLKMRLQSTFTSQSADNPLTVVNLQACGDDPIFGKYTPSGNLNFSVIPAVAQHLEVGRDYHVDLVPVVPAALGLAPHEQRVVEEHAARAAELDRLLNFFDTPIYAGMLDEDRELMLEQSRHMAGLVDALARRIDRFKGARE